MVPLMFTARTVRIAVQIFQFKRSASSDPPGSMPGASIDMGLYAGAPEFEAGPRTGISSALSSGTPPSRPSGWRSSHGCIQGQVFGAYRVRASS